MPASLEHLLTARHVLPLLHLDNLSLYYLGSVVPDAPNLDGFADRETRWNAHLRAADPNRWMENAVRFVRGQNGLTDHSYLLGYAVHITGDIVWDELFEKGLRKAVKADRLSRGECFTRRWDEHYRFEREQLSADWWLHEVKPLLAAAEPAGINGLSEDFIRRFQNYLLTRYAPSPQYPAVGYVTAERMEAFGDHVARRLQKAGLA